jgi:hypothetical protein
MEAELQHAFASYQEEFKLVLEESAQALRRVISAAQHSIAEQVTQGGPEQFQPSAAQTPTPPLKPITAEVVEEAFTKAKNMLDQMERASVDAQAGPPFAQTTEPPPEMPSGPAASDPLTASDYLMTQATQSLNAAMDAIVQAMNRRPSGPPTG